MEDTPFSVNVLVDGHVLDPLPDEHGFYVRGRPGTRYEIQLGFEAPVGSTVVAKVFVDGEPVFLGPKYARSLMPGTLRVRGYDVERIVQDVDADTFQEAHDIRPFVFTFPFVTVGPADPNLGTIRVELYEALPRERTSTRGAPPSLVRPTALQPRQGKKVHMSERMTTVAGEKERTAFAIRSKSGKHTVFDEGRPLHTLCLRYFQDHGHGGRSSGSGSGSASRHQGLQEARDPQPAHLFAGPGVRLGGRPREDHGPRTPSAAVGGAAPHPQGNVAPDEPEEVDADIAAAMRNSLATSQQEMLLRIGELAPQSPEEEALLVDDAMRQSLRSQEEDARLLAEAMRRSLQSLEADDEMDHAAVRRAILRSQEEAPAAALPAAGAGPAAGSSAAELTPGPAAAELTPGPAAAELTPGPAAAEPAVGTAAAAAGVRSGAAASEAGAPEPEPSAGAAAPEPEPGAGERPGDMWGVFCDYRVGEDGHLRALYRLPQRSSEDNPGHGVDEPAHVRAVRSLPGQLVAAEAAPEASWQKYHDEGGIWWYRSDSDWFREDDPGEWQCFRIPGSTVDPQDPHGGCWWYRHSDEDWFLRDTGAKY